MTNFLFSMLLVLSTVPVKSPNYGVATGAGWEFFDGVGKVDSKAFLTSDGEFHIAIHVSNRDEFTDISYVKYEFYNFDGKVVATFFTEDFSINDRHKNLAMYIRIKHISDKGIKSIGVIPVVRETGKTPVNNNYPKTKKVEKYVSNKPPQENVGNLVGGNLHIY